MKAGAKRLNKHTNASNGLPNSPAIKRYKGSGLTGGLAGRSGLVGKANPFDRVLKGLGGGGLGGGVMRVVKGQDDDEEDDDDDEEEEPVKDAACGECPHAQSTVHVLTGGQERTAMSSAMPTNTLLFILACLYLFILCVANLTLAAPASPFPPPPPPLISALSRVASSSAPWSLEHFNIGKALGRGKFGNVYLARTKGSCLEGGLSPATVALKVLFKNQLASGTAPLLLRREVEIQCRLEHQCVLRMFGYFHNDSHVYLILEEATGGEVYKIMAQSGGYLSQGVAARYIRDVSDALRYLEKREVYHRDIKPENMLVGGDGLVKLSDFGWAIHAPRPMDRRSTLCGTPEYVAPEMLLNSDYNGSVDRWSLGVLAYELVVGKTPFFCSTSKWNIDDDAVFKKTLHDTIFESVKGWEDMEWESKLFSDEIIWERSGRRVTADELFDFRYKEVVVGLMKKRGEDRMPVEDVFERLSLVANDHK